jgi:hypothetical protein
MNFITLSATVGVSHPHKKRTSNRPQRQHLQATGWSIMLRLLQVENFNHKQSGTIQLSQIKN